MTGNEKNAADDSPGDGTTTIVVASLAFSLFLAPMYPEAEPETALAQQYLVETGSSSVAPGLCVPLPVR